MDISSAPPAPKAIQRADYQPPEWLVPEVTLSFNLGIEQTKVVATLKVKRNAASQVLRLSGDGIAAEAVLVDGQPTNAWRMASDRVVNAATLPAARSKPWSAHRKNQLPPQATSPCTRPKPGTLRATCLR